MKQLNGIISFINQYQILELTLSGLFIFGIGKGIFDFYIEQDIDTKTQIGLFVILSSSLTGFALLILWRDMKKQFLFLSLEEDHMVFFMALSMAIWAMNSTLTSLDIKNELISQIANIANTGAIVAAYRYVYFRNEDEPIWWNNKFFVTFRKGRKLVFILLTTIVITIIFYWLRDKVSLNDTIILYKIPAFFLALVTLYYLYQITAEVFKIRGFKIFAKTINAAIFALVALGQILLTFGEGMPKSIQILYIMGLQALFLVLIISWYNYIRPERNTQLVRQMNHAVKDSLTILEGDIIQLMEQKENISSVLDSVKKRISRIRDLHEYLHGEDFKSFSTNIKYQEDDKNGVIELNLIDYLEKFFEAFKENFQLSGDEFSYSFSSPRKKIWVNIPVAQSIGKVLLELNTNSVENCRKIPNHEIIITNKLEFKDIESLNVSVEDNGSGFLKEMKDGFGLTLVRNIVDYYGGELTLSESEKVGTKWSITNISLR